MKNDPDLLALMLKDARAADPLYQPTNYWAVYEKRILTELRRRGLCGFASRKGSAIASFGAADCFPRRMLPFRSPQQKRIEEFKNRVFTEAAALPAR